MEPEPTLDVDPTLDVNPTPDVKPTLDADQTLTQLTAQFKSVQLQTDSLGVQPMDQYHTIQEQEYTIKSLMQQLESGKEYDRTIMTGAQYEIYETCKKQMARVRAGRSLQGNEEYSSDLNSIMLKS